jgi:hypothetical protein
LLQGRPAGAGIARVRRFVIVVTVLALAVALLPTGQTSARAQDVPFVRDIREACPLSVQNLRPYLDMPSDAHAGAVGCLAYHRIVEGRVEDGARIFDAGAGVTRGQMAAFLARTIEFLTEEQIPLTIGYEDDAGEHQTNIRKLATVEVGRGFDDGTFRPDETVTREQMATFIARALEVVLADQLPEQAIFDDVGEVHAANVGKLAALGVVAGRDDGTFGPRLPVNRAQMSSFVARALDVAAERSVFPDLLRVVDGTPSVEGDSRPGSPGVMAVTNVQSCGHPYFDRVLIELGGTGNPGYRAEYVQQARQRSNGEPIEIAGDHIIRLVVTGVAEPDELPDDIQPYTRARRDGQPGSQVLEIVNDRAIDGEHVIYIGTTSYAPFVVQRGADPTRVVLDIFRGFDEPLPAADPGVVSSFSTPLTPGQVRNNNIHLAADYIDGDVIPPGGTYSLSRSIGPRTTARGFGPGGFISDGEIITVTGGGISQLATTFVNAAWFAGIELVDFKPHSIYFTRYPMCREATLSGTSIDVIVTNDSPYDITIRTSHSQSQVTISFVSEPWAEVSSWTGSPRNVVGGIGGAFSVSCGRTVTYPQGITDSETYGWRYSEGYPG